MTKIAVLGGGSWGTALAILLSRARRPHEVSLWARDAALAEAMRTTRENATYLPGFRLPDVVRVTHDLADALRSAEVLISAIPAAYARDVYTRAAEFVPDGAAIVSATKGLEPKTHARMSEVIAGTLGPEYESRIAILSGPSFATEAARGQPTAVVLASKNAAFAAELQEDLAGPTFRLYTNDDVLGTELAGAMKNVIAIAAGVCQGLGLGSNSQAALITRGLAEMTRLAVSLGAKTDTLSGLAGLGDLVLTCTGTLSRNRNVGIDLGRGKALPDIVHGMKMVAEGVGTTPALMAVARSARVEMPITEQVNALLYEEKPPVDAIRDIMERPLKRE